MLRFVNKSVLLVLAISGSVLFFFSGRRWPPTVDDIQTAIIRSNEKFTRQQLDSHVNEYIEKSKHFTVKPRRLKLIRDRANPCWREGDKLRCLPKFYIAGFAKSASTDLWFNVIEHPQVVSPCEKEPNWWATTRYEPSRRTFDEYVNCFTNMTSKPANFITGDASVVTLYQNYLMSRKNAATEELNQPSSRLMNAVMNHELLPPYLIYKFTQNAKFIVIMRNPTDRLYSEYNAMRYHLRRRFENGADFVPQPGVAIPDKATPQDFHRVVVQRIEAYRQCLRRGDVRSCLYHDFVIHPKNQVRLVFGMYVLFINDALRLIPRHNFLFINYHHYIQDKPKTLKRVFNFLGLESSLDSARMVRRRRSRENASPFPYPPMLNETRQLLDELYRPYNQILARYLNDSSLLFTGYT